ncbi:Na+/phosphate symporter [Dysgonomonas sp. PH5-45]|uniref:hypothetical protein n=1 Tax=unclassified Dysgonomonas TaxID=2630389 RepID=UPI0024756538|nr:MULTISPECIES: hypothetical protein [unclassified Dysgonomonas]MDH6354506.1 Na+/phosphate symporter [Dysgonomonas sp. PH5-45]MDH6387437.1 Na+/phosphate symporter [Dysgonomonas sp. PH5-37]
MSTVYEYFSEAELRDMREQGQITINTLKQNQPPMKRIRINKNTIIEIAEGKSIKQVLRRLNEGRKRFYMAD